MAELIKELEELYNSTPEGVAPEILWIGLSTLKQEYGLFTENPEKGRWALFEEHLTATKIYSEAESRGAAMILIDMLEKAGVPLEKLQLSSLIELAYQEEAKVMREFGLDPEITPPFTVGIRLNRSHPLVKEVLKQQEEESQRFWERELSFLDGEPPGI